jgi:predicted secreted protein
LVKKGVGIYQIPCPEVELQGIFRKPLPKESYDHPRIRKVYRKLSDDITKTLQWYNKKGYKIVAVIGAEGSPTCGIDLIGRWKENRESKKSFPKDIEFVSGKGVFMEEFEISLGEINIYPEWIGIPGKSVRITNSESFKKTLDRLEAL